VFGEQTCWVQFPQVKGSGGSESFDSAGKIQIQPEQAVLSDVPIFFLLGAEVPQLIRAGDQGAFKHVNGCTESIPKTVFQISIHNYYRDL
jgi:hypothetical protein